MHSLEEENFIEAMAQAFNGRTQTYWMGAKPNGKGSRKKKSSTNGWAIKRGGGGEGAGP